MSLEQDGETTIYDVVVNHEEQYSIWPHDKAPPLGWQATGKCGLRSDCLLYVKEVWTDMRPLSLRKKMAELEARRPELEREEARRLEDAKGRPPDARDDLVAFLSTGDHPIEAWLQPDRSIDLLQESVDRGFAHVRFMDTRGTTVLGFDLDRRASDLSRADFADETGAVHLEGELTLDDVKVRCIADLELGTLTGRGMLRRLS
jgi:uncharacterized protein YbdZ (MbtH family)